MKKDPGRTGSRQRRSRMLLSGLLAVALPSACSDDEGSTESGPTGTVDAGTCGDGIASGDEVCDGDDLKGESCSSVTMGAMSDGTLACSVDCTFDSAGCTSGAGGSSGGGGTGATGPDVGGSAGVAGATGVAGAAGSGGTTGDAGGDASVDASDDGAAPSDGGAG